MSYPAILLTMAQIAVAITGFSGIVAAFLFKETSEIRRGDAIGLAMIVSSSLVAAFFSILPFIFFSFKLNEEFVWSLCSGLMSLNFMAYYIYFFIHLKKMKMKKSASRARIYTMSTIGGVVLTMNIFNAIAFIYKGEFGPYLIAIVYALTIISIMFYRLIIVPVWEKIKDH